MQWAYYFWEIGIMTNQTPCEKLGYKVGDRFEVTAGSVDSSYRVGFFVTLERDDGTDLPKFTSADGCTSYYLHLDQVKKIGQTPQILDNAVKATAKYTTTLFHGHWVVIRAGEKIPVPLNEIVDILNSEK